MAFFDDIGKKISQTTQSAVKGAKEMADIAGLNMKISEEQGSLNSLYAQIGKKYYELHSETADENFSELCTSVTECSAKIANLEEEVKKIKGIKRCQSCGAEVPMTATFCGTCGAETREEPEPVEPAEPSGQVATCPNCNQELTGGAAFCGNCGHKI